MYFLCIYFEITVYFYLCMDKLQRNGFWFLINVLHSGEYMTLFLTLLLVMVKVLQSIQLQSVLI